LSVLYKASVTSVGGRDGGVKSDDGILDLQLALPPGLGGPGGKTNPEQLFAAGYAACFHGALKKMAGAHKASLHDSKVTAEVGIGPNASGGLGLEVDLHVALPKVERALAEQLIHEAHQFCPYSIATRGNIPVRIVLANPGEAAVAVA
jgi:Ohr subfamily peroxiredoxin